MGLLNSSHSYLSPHNQGRTKFVQQELDFTISRANSQILEAIAVDGVELDYWKKVEEGNFCTCGFGLNHPKNIKIDNQTINTSNQTLTPSGVGVVPESFNPGSVVVTNAWNDPENPQDNTDPDVLGDRPQEDATKTNKEFRTNPLKTKPQETGNNDSDDYFSAPEGYDLLTGMERTQCGICLGAGKTNSWALLGGRREIFDSYTVANQSGFLTDWNARPVAFKAPKDPTAYVEWVYTLPTYFEKCLNYSVRNNTRAVRDLKLFYRIDGTQNDWVRLSSEFLNSRNGTPTTLRLRVQPTLSDLEGLLTFTHFEIIWQLGDFPFAQMDHLSVATNQQIKDTIVTSSFVLPPTIESVTKNDVFFDRKYGKMWEFTDFTDNLTSQRQVLGWTISARSMAPFEQKSLLQIAHKRYYQVAYDGIEEFSLDPRL